MMDRWDDFLAPYAQAVDENILIAKRLCFI